MYKKRTVIFLFVFCMILIPFISMWIYICRIDPLYLFYDGGQAEITEKKYLTANMRLQARGLVNVYDFDSIILGTSMLENTSSLYAGNILGDKFINLSVSGSNFEERSYILDYVLKSKKIKTVLYSVDLFCFFEKNKNLDWTIIYNDSQFIASKIYLQRDFLKFLFNVDKRKFVTPDELIYWYPYFESAFGGFKNFIETNNHNYGAVINWIAATLKNKKKGITNTALKRNEINELQKIIDLYFTTVVQNNPQTNFYYIIPPYWRGAYTGFLYSNHNEYVRHQEMIKYLVQVSHNYNNMFVYFFETEPFLDDFKNYKDTTHYHPNINNYMIDCIKMKKNLLTVDNVDEYLKKAEEMAKNFDIEKVVNEVNTILKEKNLKLIED